MKRLSELAKEKAGMGPEWEPYMFESFPRHPQQATRAEITGAVAPLITRGKSKGQRNWRKMDRSTKRVIYIDFAEYREWEAEWEKKTGKCAECEEGREWCGWSESEGHRYRTCLKCKGTGKPASLQS